MEQVSGWSEQGGSVVTIPGTQGSGAQRFQQSFRGATITVRDSSNNLATIYSDDLASPTAKANPFTASSTTGSWNFYTTTGTYTLTFSGGSITAPFSITVNVGLGNAGGVPSYAFASLPTSKSQNAGDIARVTNLLGGLWMDSGDHWSPVYPIINAYEMTGASASARIIAAIARVPSTGGVVDARSFEGAQSIAATITIAKPILLLLGAANFSGSVDPLISVTTASNIGTHIKGMGPGVTTLTQTGAGRAILISDATEIVFPHVSGMSIVGSSTGSKAIDTNQVKNGTFEDLNIASFLDHSIDLRGADNYNNVIRRTNFTAGTGALTTGRCVNFRAGNQNRIEDCYFNVGGTITTRTVTDATNATPIVVTTSAAHGMSNGQLVTIAGVLGNTSANGEFMVASAGATTFALTNPYTSANIAGNGAYTSGGSAYYSNRYSTAIDAYQASSLTLDSNIYDGVVQAVKTSTTTLAKNEYVDLTGGSQCRFGYLPLGSGGLLGASNILTLIGTTNSDMTRMLLIPSDPAADKYLSFTANDGQHSANMPGSLMCAVITPAQITADQNNYTPDDSSNSQLLGRFSSFWRLNSDATVRSITGMGGGAAGKVRIITNTGSTPIKFINGSGSSVAANRLQTIDTANAYLRTREMMIWVYDVTSSIWRLVFHNPSSANHDDTITPSQLTGNTDNWAPASAYLTHYWRIAADAPRNLTGISIDNLVAQTGIGAGYILNLTNISANAITFINNATSTAEYRFILGAAAANIALAQNQTITLIYDETTARWRLVSLSA